MEMKKDTPKNNTGSQKSLRMFLFLHCHLWLFADEEETEAAKNQEIWADSRSETKPFN